MSFCVGSTSKHISVVALEMSLEDCLDEIAQLEQIPEDDRTPDEQDELDEYQSEADWYEEQLRDRQ